MLMFMQALPGRQSRVTPGAPPAAVTRANAAADQRRRLLRGVGELVAERGYADVTVELIVKRARCSFKTFYKHYRGKEECFVDLFDSAFSKAEAEIRERLTQEAVPWAEQVELALGMLIERIVADPVIARALIVDSLAVGPPIIERYEQATKALVPLFRAGRELSPRGRALPQRIEDSLSGSVLWSIYQRLVIGQSDQLPALVPELTELVLRTYLGSSAEGRTERSEAPQAALA
jgi:AcrR family transcriptional regulator